MGGEDAGKVDAGGVVDAGGIDSGTEDDAGDSEDAGPDAAGDAGTMEDAGPPDPCGDLSERPRVMVTEPITADATWDCTNVYVLTDVIFVGSGDLEAAPVELSIPPGTVVMGEKGDLLAGELPGALIVTRTGRLDAAGTLEQPIVFTSLEEPGARAPGDWGGVALLGRAPNNTSTGEGALEGLPSGETRGTYGVPTDDQDPTWNCGTLRYARIEFAGFELAATKELNGLTVGSCGTGTELSYIQVHRGSDDGVEFFGGNVDVDHLVVTGADDDSIDWDEGFQGRLQFVVIQQWADDPDNGFESDNDGSTPTATPISSPRIFNLTMLGNNESNSDLGMHLRAGTHGFVANAIVAGFGKGTIDVETIESATAATNTPPELTVQNSILVGVPGVLFPAGPDDGPDGDLSESTVFQAEPLMNRTFADWPSAMAMNLLPDPFNTETPSWVPVAESPAAAMAATPSEADGETRPAFFDDTATYVGAFAPGGDDWTQGWTAYPEQLPSMSRSARSRVITRAPKGSHPDEAPPKLDSSVHETAAQGA